MQEWKKVKLGDCIKEVVEKTTENNQYTLLSVTKTGIYAQEDFFKKQIASKNNIGYKIIRKNDLVFSTMNLWMGSLDVLTSYDIGIVSPSYKVFKINEKIMFPQYANYYMKSEYMIEIYKNFSAQGASVVRRNLDLKSLLNSEILLPNLETQVKIINILSNVDEIIAKLEIQIKEVEKQKKGLMQRMFSEGIGNDDFKNTEEGKIPQNWNLLTIDEIFSKVTDYVAAGSFADLKEKIQYNSSKNFAQLIRTVDIKSNFKNKESIYVSKSAFDFLWRVNLVNENVILPNIGANIGEVYYITPEIFPYKNNVLGPNAILLGGSKYTKYMYYYFSSNKFRKKLDLIVAASGQPKFNKTELKQIKCYIPNETEKDKIVNILDIIYIKRELIKNIKQEYENLRQGLMQQLLTGKIRVE